MRGLKTIGIFLRCDLNAIFGCSKYAQHTAVYVICATDINNVAGAVLLIEMNGAAPPTFKMRREQPPGAFKMSLWQKCA
jgi:hypothetical protein